jgi:hypothetical protein
MGVGWQILSKKAIRMFVQGKITARDYAKRRPGSFFVPQNCGGGIRTTRVVSNLKL